MVYHGTRRMLREPFPQSYYRKLLSMETDSLVALWRQNERSGSVSKDWGPNGNDGAYTGVTLANAAGPDQMPVPFYDGTNDYNNIFAIASELLDNPGFETAGGGGADIWANWTENAGDGALANETTNIHTGSDAAKLTAGSSADTYVDQNATVTAGETYELRFWTRGDGSDEGRYSLYDVDNSADIVATTGTGVTGTSYTKVSVEFTAPAGCSTVRIRLQCSTTDTAVCYFDSCSCRDVNGFDGQEGTVLVWAKMANAGVWTDGTYRDLLRLYAKDGQFRIQKTNATNNVRVLYVANDIEESLNVTMSTTEWFVVIATWSTSGDAVVFYLDGAEEGRSDTLGTWAGTLIAAGTVFGAANNTPLQVWHGWIGPVAIWNKALTPTQIAEVSEI